MECPCHEPLKGGAPPRSRYKGQVKNTIQQEGNTPRREHPLFRSGLGWHRCTSTAILCLWFNTVRAF